MRIVLVNWARIWEGASQGGGVNQYVQALALELVKRGHEVVSLCGGAEHDPSVSGTLIRRHHDWLGIKVFEVVNSPVLAPSLAQFERPLDEVSCPALERLVADLFGWLRPGAAHWNNLEGFTVGCVTAAKAAGARNIFSLHNYHTICPQVYLMQGHRVPCMNYDNGHACASCVQIVPVEEERRKYEQRHARGSPAPPLPGSSGGGARREAIAELRESVRWIPRSARATARLVRLTVAGDTQADGTTPGSGAQFSAHQRDAPGGIAGAGKDGASGAQRGRIVRSDEDVSGPFTMPGPVQTLTSSSGTITKAAADQRGHSPHLLAELNPPGHEDRSLPQFAPLTNDIPPQPASNKPPNDYAKRRAAMVAMLNSCDRVLAVSSFVERKFISMGVSERVIRTRPIGSRINRVVALKPDLAFAPPPFTRTPLPPGVEHRPIRLHFMGFNNYYKGLGFLANALEELEPDVLRKLHLSIFALDGHSIEWMFRRMEPRLAGLRFGYQYHYHDIPWMLGGRDMTIVPSLWWDNGPQTVFESLACGVPVLGAAVGGIPDFVRDGENGLLFRANDREDFKRVVRRLAAQPWIIDDLRGNVRPPKSIEEHAAEMESLYAGQD